VVAALMVVNPAGSVVDPSTGELYAAAQLHPSERAGLERTGLGDPAPLAAGEAASTARTRPGLATTIGVIATDAAVTKAQCAKLAGVGHDGLARAIRPAHSMVDGDTLFALSTGTRPAPGLDGFNTLLAASADVVTRAIANAVLSATTAATSAGVWRSYRDVFRAGG
jgi:putative pantetheine hydrolase